MYHLRYGLGFIFITRALLAFEASPILKATGISFFPAVQEGGKILIPFKTPPAKDTEIVLLHQYSDLFRLKPTNSKMVYPKTLHNPTNHHIYELAEGNLTDRRTNLLVAMGKNVKSIIKWGSTGTISADFPTSCMEPRNGFATTHLEVYYSKILERKIFYAVSTVLQSTFDKMTPEEKDSGEQFREVVGISTRDGKCQILAFNTRDGDGKNNKGTKEPVGKIYGLINLDRAEQKENWVVLDGQGYEISGFTFIQVPSQKSTSVPQQFFLGQDGL